MRRGEEVKDLMEEESEDRELLESILDDPEGARPENATTESATGVPTTTTTTTTAAAGSSPPGSSTGSLKALEGASMPVASKRQLAKTKSKTKAMAGAPLFELVSQRYVSIESLKEFNESKMYWRYKDAGGGTPLHRLCANTACTERHIEACREVLTELRIGEERDNMGRTPLHLAAMNPSATPEFITEVIRLDESALVAVPGENGAEYPRDTPLHAACRSPSTPVATLSALAQANPSVCSMEDHKGQVPLAVLCEKPAPKSRDSPEAASGYYRVGARSADGQSLVEKLLAVGDLVPHAARRRNVDGQTPLHLLCSHTTSIEALAYLGRLYPDAALAQDSARQEDCGLEHALEGGGCDKDASQYGGDLFSFSRRTHLSSSSSSKDKASSRRRRKSGSNLDRVTKLFGNMTMLISTSPTHKNRVADGGATPLHVLCGREAKLTPDMIRTVGQLRKSAAVAKTAVRKFAPMHLLCMNESNAGFANLKAVLELAPEAALAVDAKNHTPLDVMPSWLVDRLAPQLMLLFPKAALQNLASCNYCLLHYACIKDQDTVEMVVESMYKQLVEQPPLAVYLQLPELSRERLATTRSIVNQVDRIFTAPSVVAYLVAEFSTAVLMVICFFDLCVRFAYQRQTENPESLWVLDAVLCGFHALWIVVMKCLQARALYRHDRFRQFFTIWNVVDFMTVVAFVATLITGLYDRNRSFRVVASISQLIVPLRLLRIIKGLNQRLGAFVLCLTNIIVAIVPFLFVFFLALVSFSQVFHVLMHDNDAREATELRLDGSIESESHFASPLRSLYEVILIVLIGDFERDYFQTDLSIVLVVIMLLVGVVIMLNVLISVVSDAYERTLTNAEAIYLRSRLESAAEMQQVLPAWFFNRNETRIFIVVGLVFFPVTFVWLLGLYLTRLIGGKKVVVEYTPRRLLAYAKPPGHEEEEDRPSSNSQADHIQKNLVRELKKLHDDVLARLNNLEIEIKLAVEHELQAALDKLDREFQSMKTSNDHRDVLTKQGQVLDRLVANLNAPIAHLPPDIQQRVDQERGLTRPGARSDDEDDDYIVSCHDDIDNTRFVMTC